MASDFPINAMTKEFFLPPNYLRHKMSILRQTFGFPLVAALLLITAQRLPAPIVEEATPTPAAPAAKSRPSSKKEEPAKKPTPSKPTISSFVGTWTGTVSASFASDVGLNTSGNALRTVKISSDGSVVYFSQSGGQVGPTNYSRVIVSKGGRGVSWTNQQNEHGGVSRG